jgi:hypothetical protein
MEHVHVGVALCLRHAAVAVDAAVHRLLAESWVQRKTNRRVSS